MVIVNEVNYMDLRKLRIQHAAMKKWADKYKLKNDQAILFSNEKGTRFRLLAKMYNILHICIPQTDVGNEVSMYALVAGVYAELTRPKKKEEVAALVKWARKRVRRRRGRRVA